MLKIYLDSGSINCLCCQDIPSCRFIGKPLFIPLITEYYNRFLTGDKTSELRIYGKRWNEKTCFVGRGVILSKGYGKKFRQKAVITEFHKRKSDTFGSTYQNDIKAVYGDGVHEIAEIRLRLVNE